MTLSLRERQLVEPLRVAEQNRVFVRRAQLSVFPQLFQLMLARLRIDLVRVVGGENVWFVARDTHGLGDAKLLAFAADKYAAGVDVTQNIVDDLLAFLELQKALARIELHMACPGAGEAFHTG